jgi:OOP family OmpA-OmpF porin
LKKSLIIIAILAFETLKAQETVVWASQVIDVSSEFGLMGYSATQALHKPNVFPAGGDNPNAWRPKVDNNEQYIVVAFDRPIQAKQIAIAESENPGAIKRVLAYDEEYLEYTLLDLKTRAIPIESRLLNIFFDDTPYKIYAIKVVIDGAAVPGYNCIDAIGISVSNIPISVLINNVPGINENFATEKLSANVNSTYHENSPIISPDGKRLYFSRKYHPDNTGGVEDAEDIWMSEIDESTGSWKPAVNVGSPLNNSGPNFISSITMVNGTETLILGNKYGSNGRMFEGVSMSERNGNSFSKPKDVEIENEYNYSARADFFLVSGGESMILSVERDDYFGARDLYISKKNGRTWSEPKNLGGIVNTAGEDFAPFLAEDNKTLYYSTNGFSGYGGSDIFVTIRLDDSWEKWSIPENLGSGINSKDDDQYFSIPSSGKHIYFSRGDIDSDTDIFRFNSDDLFQDSKSVNPISGSINHLTTARPDELFVTIEGRVLDYQTKEGIASASVVVERLPDGRDVGKINTDSSYYSIKVRGGASYGIHANKYGHLTQSFNFDFNSLKESKTIVQDLYLTKILVDAKIVINNIFFDFNKAELKTASFAELDRICGSISDGQIKKIRISGHTDDIGSDEYNQNLSENRARAVFDYFRTKGIPDYRMEVVGYGESTPIAANDTEEGQSKNRRVEFEILALQ